MTNRRETDREILMTTGYLNCAKVVALSGKDQRRYGGMEIIVIRVAIQDRLTCTLETGRKEKISKDYEQVCG